MRRQHTATHLQKQLPQLKHMLHVAIFHRQVVRQDLNLIFLLCFKDPQVAISQAGPWCVYVEGEGEAAALGLTTAKGP